MADPRFFCRAGPFSVEIVAKAIGSELAGSEPADVFLKDVMPLDDAGSGHLAFIDNRKYLEAYRATKASAIIVAPELVDLAPSAAIVLISENPYLAYARAAALFYPVRAIVPGIAGGSHVAAGASVSSSCRVEPGAVIEENVEISDNTVIGANAVIRAGVSIGTNCQIGANATLQHCKIGDRCIIHPGVCIGQDGFGFALAPDGHLKVPQLGRVIVEHDVEIGANTTIDRGAGPDTVIGAGTKIDNLVQIGHNVRVGRGCIIVSQVGISGSTQLEDFVMIGGQAGFAGHLRVGKGAKIGAQSGVMRDVAPGSTIGGSPAKDMREWLKETAVLAKLAKK